MQIRLDSTLTHPDVIALLEAHLDDMRAISPPESVHALDLDALRGPTLRFWTAWSDSDSLMGCAALKIHDATLGEIKSMRTSRSHLRQGVAAALLNHVIESARELGLQTLSLETGSTEHFAAARRLYEVNGFSECPPFADYTLDPHSTFMTRSI